MFFIQLKKTSDKPWLTVQMIIIWFFTDICQADETEDNKWGGTVPGHSCNWSIYSDSYQLISANQSS